MENTIALYSGPETSHFKVGDALDNMGIGYNLIDQQDFRDRLDEYQAIIIPGGHTQRVFHDLGKSFDKIREFVSKGGGYIGISAGALLASKKIPENLPEGIGLIDIECRYAPEAMKKERSVILCVKGIHPVTRGVSGKYSGPLWLGPEANSREQCPVFGIIRERLMCSGLLGLWTRKGSGFQPPP